MNTEQTQETPRTPKPKILIVLFIFSIIQLALAIAIIICLAVMNFVGFGLTIGILVNTVSTCTNNFLSLKNITSLDERVSAAFIASAVATLTGLIIFILSLKILCTASKRVEQQLEEEGRRGLIKTVRVRIISLFVGYILIRVMYVIQSIFLLAIITIFGIYLAFLIELPQACSFIYLQEQLLIFVILGGIALLIGLIVWIIIVCIIFGVKSELFSEEDEKEKAKTEQKSEKKVEKKKNEDESYKSRESNKKKKQEKYHREETFEDLRDYEKEREQERVEEERRKTANTYEKKEEKNYYEREYEKEKDEEKKYVKKKEEERKYEKKEDEQDKYYKKRQDDRYREEEEKKRERDVYRKYNTKRQPEQQLKQKEEEPKKYYDKYREKEPLTKYDDKQDPYKSKYQPKKEQKYDVSPDPSRKRGRYADAPTNNNGSGYDLSPKNKNNYRSKVHNQLDDEPYGKSPQRDYNDSIYRSPQRHQGLIYSRNPREEPSSNLRAQRDNDSPLRNVDDSQYYPSQSKDLHNTRNRDRFHDDPDGTKERDYLNSQLNNKILPEGGIYEGSRSKKHDSYFKDSRNSSFGNAPKKRRGILNDYIRGKYIE